MFIESYHNLLDSLRCMFVLANSKSAPGKLKFAKLLRLNRLRRQFSTNNWFTGQIKKIYTSSTVSFMMYRMMVTVLSCPSLRIRPIAWLSIEGFHCGSMI